MLYYFSIDFSLMLFYFFKGWQCILVSVAAFILISKVKDTNYVSN